MANGNRSLGRGLGDLMDEVSTVKAIQTPPAPPEQPATPPPPAGAEPPEPKEPAPPEPTPAAAPPARTKRTPLVAVIAVLVIGWIVSLLLLGSQKQDLARMVELREQRILDLEAELTQEARAAALEDAPPVVPMPVPTTPEPAAEDRLAWARGLSIPGVQVDATDERVRLVFDTPVFAFRTELSGDAEPLLRTVAAAVLPNAGAAVVTVVGHTDNDPVRAGGPFRDNLDLALRRAAAVADVLRRDGGLPPEAVVARGAPDTASPFPNDTPENKLRNRTVTLEIRPR